MAESRVWLYTRGPQSVRMVREVMPTGVVYLTLTGPDRATWMYVGTSLACEKYQAGLQDSLAAEGFLINDITDRRQRDRVSNTMTNSASSTPRSMRCANSSPTFKSH